MALSDVQLVLTVQKAEPQLAHAAAESQGRHAAHVSSIGSVLLIIVLIVDTSGSGVMRHATHPIPAAACPQACKVTGVACGPVKSYISKESLPVDLPQVFRRAVVPGR
ncbi:hypothetical protein ABC383_25025 [Noviherbaspirillum sp. 1P10PC]|uniref:hypothetical protein n=1 Tax=Noviherbaspirillum sp. 1P10PC TaxID=3132292 RepID=UPI0039A382BE